MPLPTYAYCRHHPQFCRLAAPDLPRSRCLLLHPPNDASVFFVCWPMTYTFASPTDNIINVSSYCFSLHPLRIASILCSALPYLACCKAVLSYGMQTFVTARLLDTRLYVRHSSIALLTYSCRARLPPAITLPLRWRILPATFYRKCPANTSWLASVIPHYYHVLACTTRTCLCTTASTYQARHPLIPAVIYHHPPACRHLLPVALPPQ